jgi:exopolysaccharide production protein ExoZ
LIPAHGAQGQVAPVLGVGWTLSFEMFFYVLFACALMLRIDLIRFLTPIMLGLAFIGLFHRDTWPAVSVLMNPLLLEFLAGVWIGRAVYQRTRIPSALSAVLGMAGLVTIMVVPQGDFPGSRVLGWGICSVLIVQAAVMLEDSFGEWLPGWVLRVGDASYSLYLIHLLVLSKVAWALLRLRVLTPGVVSRREEMIMIVLCLLCTVPAAFVCYRWVELPLNGFLQRKMGLRKVQVQ